MVGVEPEGIRIHDGTPFVAWQPTEVVIDFSQARLLSPVFPTKIVGVAHNYELHAEEMGRISRQRHAPDIHQTRYIGHRTRTGNRVTRTVQRGSS